MYHLAIRQFARSLKNLDTIIGKAVSHAEARKFDVNNFIGLRLFPDMLPFAKQVQIATDMAKAAAANLGGKEAPKFEDNEKTVDELRARLRKCISFLESFTPVDFEKVTAKTVVKIPFPGRPSDGRPRSGPRVQHEQTRATDETRGQGLPASARGQRGALRSEKRSGRVRAAAAGHPAHRL
jgi:hypothetical protein